MNFKCPNCKSTKTSEIIKSTFPPLPSHGFQATQESCYQDHSLEESEFQEYICLNCGIVTKISTQYYKEIQKRLSDELMRDTLLSIEKLTKGTYPDGISPSDIFDDLEQYTNENIEYCLDRLNEKNFIKRIVGRVIQILPEGKDFLDT